MIVNKVIKTFVFLKSLCKYVEKLAFLKICKTYILPIIESNLIFWVKIKHNSIEKFQKMITKFICKKLSLFMLNISIG
jgi:hypothetical protein